MINALDIDAQLKRCGIRRTAARRNVLGVLLRSDEPLLVAEIAARLAAAAEPADLVTVYRTIETLEQHGLAVRVDRLADGWRYASRHGAHRHLIVCSRCGTSTALEHCELASIDKTLEHRTGFSEVHHSLQFFGTCPACQTAAG